MSYDGGPFSQDPPESIHLVNTPLARVLCQVRWPELTRLIKDFEGTAENIGASLADDYPLFAVRRESNIVLGPNGISSSAGVPIYQWSTANGQFVVHFSHTFLTVETARYSNKEDLIGRLEKVLNVVNDHVSIPICSRLGYRYTNRVLGDIDIRPLASILRGGWRGLGLIPSYVAGW
jgi:uncharacterized protein (TIGR04255 family)